LLLPLRFLGLAVFGLLDQLRLEGFAETCLPNSVEALGWKQIDYFDQILLVLPELAIQ